ncbi:MAG: glycosyltransferase family 2 protein [Candidatus Aminicenantes bacterium]|nr:glycosyltransferase family 2 protein [Candidatus Aminicenantes bacterium]
MKDVIFSLVITTKNSLGVIERLVEILLNQDFNSPYEMIFMDNNSTDGTVDYLEKAGFQYQQIINVPEGQFSHSRTRMKAAELAKGQIILFFTDDIIPVGTNFLSNLTRPLVDKKASSTYGVFQIDERTADPIDAYIHNDWHKTIKDISGPVSSEEWDSASPEEKRRLCNFDNCASCIDRDVLLKIRFPDVPYGEDMFFAKRMILNNHRIAISRQAKFFHWHKMSFGYLLKRMCIDQHLSKDEFQIYYIRSKFKVVVAILKRVVHRTLIALFKLKIPFKDKIYWIFYNIKILTADFIGKYMGTLTEDVELKRFSIIDKKLYKKKKMIIKSIYEKSIIRY